MRQFVSTITQGLALRRLKRAARKAEAQAQAIRSLSDDALVTEFRSLGVPTRKTMVRSLALVREAAHRSIDLRPYPVQLMGAAALFDGVIAEMKTGEGKTLVIALAAAMAALGGEGVHVAVPNEYLAMRDAETMGPLYAFLGLTVGVSLADMSREEKQAAYAADITYAVHSELAFDYLRDHLVAASEQRVQRGLHFAIVDEADSILIDEARTPLIISQPAEDDSELVRIADFAVRPLRLNVDVTVDEAQKLAVLTEAGMDRIGAWLAHQGIVPTPQALYDPRHLHLMRYITAALRARFVYRKDQDYLIKDGQIQIIDPSTGRILRGRRWQHGLHQAIEAKEGLVIQPEMETAAEITYQSYFRLYRQFSGLTGTAVTAAEEFEAIYGRPVIEIPTNRPIIRRDLPDLLFSDYAAKFHAIVDDVVEQRKKGRPVLIGAGSVEESEALSAWLTWAGVPHRVLNARQNAEEAEIIADAGLPGAVTVATNMAGRGTDILLGGHDTSDPGHAARRAQVVAAGGLHVIGTQRMESRRVDDQLRGRAGRQGDPGSSRFYLSLDDDLLRVHGAKEFGTLAALFSRGRSETGLYSRMIDKIVRRAQRRIESAHFGARQQLFATDAVLSQQRAAVYELRNALLEGDIEVGYVESLIAASASRLVDAYIHAQTPADQWETLTLKASLKEAYGVDLPLLRWVSVEQLSANEIKDRVVEAVIERYRSHRAEASPESLTDRERIALLSALDRAWRQQLTELDALREGIYLRAYAQQNPVYVFAREARAAFHTFERVYEDAAVGYLWKLMGAEGGLTAIDTELVAPCVTEAVSPRTPTTPALTARPPIRRLAPCPCGSGLRYKHCHGRLLS